mgnify:CR=1 FL=1
MTSNEARDQPEGTGICKFLRQPRGVLVWHAGGIGESVLVRTLGCFLRSRATSSSSEPAGTTADLPCLGAAAGDAGGRAHVIYASRERARRDVA